jgi:uncharacterized protein
MARPVPRSYRRRVFGAVTAIVIDVSAMFAAPAAARAAAPAAPADQAQGITVTGSGETKAKPTTVQIPAVVKGDAELAADAIVKYRDARRRAVEALDKLKITGLSVESNGFAVNKGVDSQQQMMMMRGMANAGAAGKQGVVIIEQLKLVIKDADRMEPEKLMDSILRVVDAARDAGLIMGGPVRGDYYEMQAMAQTGVGPSIMSFTIPDPDKLREQAYKQAVEDARAQAKRLADLAGVKLGRILSIRDLGGQTVNPQNPYVVVYPGATPGTNTRELSSAMFGEIPVKATLAVQFDIEK